MSLTAAAASFIHMSDPTCPRCEHDHFTHMSLLSDDEDRMVRREVQCTACSFTGVLVATRDEDENADDVVGEWE